MAFGALAGALNTMYTSVAARAVEIATLRAIGFGGFPAFVGTLVESLVLAAIGGAARRGSRPVLIFDGFTASTLGGNFTQVVFTLPAQSPALIGQGVMLALVVGLVGGLFPGHPRRPHADRRGPVRLSVCRRMIPKSVERFSGKIMRKQHHLAQGCCDETKGSFQRRDRGGRLPVRRGALRDRLSGLLGLA